MPTHADIVVSVAVRVRIPLDADGSAPSPDEAREIAISGIRGFIFSDARGDEIEIVDAAPAKRDLLLQGV